MSKMVKLYNEIFKLMELIDCKWEEILSRKDDEIQCGSYVIRKHKEAWDDHHEYWRVSIDKPEIYSNKYTNILCFYHRGQRTGIPANLSKYDALVISKYTDTIVFSKENSSGIDEDRECTIPYDYTATPEERKFSIDLQYESEGERELMYRMVDFQAMPLLHVDLFSYAFDLFVVLSDGFVYNDLISRPFFKTGVKK